MDVYSTAPVTLGSKFSRPKKVLDISKNTFFYSSVVFAILVPLSFISDSINEIVGNIALVNLIFWGSSFVVWVISLFLSTKAGKYILEKASFSENKTRKKVATVVLLFALLAIGTLVFFIYIFSNEVLVLPVVAIQIIIFGLFAVSALLLLISAFLFKNNIFRIISLLPIIVTLSYIFLIRPHKIVGRSMLPSIDDKEYVFAEKVSYYFSNPQRGNVVIFYINDPKREYIGRIIGLPGEKISIRNSIVYINGKVLNESYLGKDIFTNSFNFIKEGEDYLIPNGQYFIMGDNRSQSSDSRTYGPIYESNIKSHVFYKYYPSEKRGFVK